MSDQDAFERILAALYDAMLDESLWPATSALIDAACGMQGNALMIRAGPQRREPGQLRRPLLPRAAPRGLGARVPQRLLPHQRERPAYPAPARQPRRAHRRPVHRPGVTDLADLQRGVSPWAGPRRA